MTTPAPQPQEWVISDKDYHIALEYFHLEARPYIPTPQPHFPNSTELIEMAHREWKNREARKGNHDEAAWTSGWISGYLTGRDEP